MPQGHAAVHWNAENDVKLFITVLAVQGITVDYSAVAKAFGPNVPGSAIQYRMKVLRKRAKDMGVNCEKSPGSTSTKRPLPPTISTPQKKIKIEKRSREDNYDSDEDMLAHLITLSSSEDNASTKGEKQAMITPPSSAEARAKARVSPRNPTKKDYKSLGDPFAALDNVNDSNGENIFGNDKSESEDSGGSDGEFGAEAYRGVPPTEI